MDRRARLEQARLYFICDAAPGGRDLSEVLSAALAGGVDIFQLRIKGATDDELTEQAQLAAELCRGAGALFVLNDRPDLVVALGADGVHVGQRDMAVALAREAVGPDRLVGVSTHEPAQLQAAAEAGADYAGVGPVHATPTKPGRAPVGLDYVRHATQHATIPFFAIGGLDAGNVGEVREAGARRVAVVRAIAEAPDPGSAAAAILDALEQAEQRIAEPAVDHA